MNFNTIGFGFHAKGITLDIKLAYDVTKLRLGADVSIEPMGPHPMIQARVALLFIWLNISIYYCAHEH